MLKLDKRPSKTEYYLNIARAVALRSTCLRRRYGAIVVLNDSIIATGYNGAPRGEANCSDINECYREKHNIPQGEQYEICVAVHAEENALLMAGPRANGATLYLACLDSTVKAQPCKLCARVIKNAGILEVIS